MKALVDHELVEAAQAGDRQALDLLLRSYLPLVYNVVGRALDGHADVDDVVQETMARAAQMLPSLRDAERFRSWVIAIAYREIRARSRVRSRRLSRESPLEAHGERPDPGPDVAETTVAGLTLSGQRREVAEATRWLSADDRQILALWWHEAAGLIDRSELAEAAGLSAQHAAVRVQRLKDRLQTARIVHRALRTGRGCPQLLILLRQRSGSDDRELQRLSRHVRHCDECARSARGLIPPQQLLAGIALLPVPDALAHTVSHALSAGAPGGFGIFSAGAAAAPSAVTKSSLILKPALVTGAAITGAGIAITFGLQILPGPGGPAPAAHPPVASADPVPAPDASPGPGPSVRAPAVAAAPVYSGYVMSYFTENSKHTDDDYGLHLAVSSDGLNWVPLNQGRPVLTPTQGTGGLRDPSVLRKQDGTFVVLATDLKGTDVAAGGQFVHVWDSPDLRTFTYHRLKLHAMDTHARAPKAFWDPARRRYGILYNAVRQGRESVFVDWTDDFVTVSEPELFFDPGYGVAHPVLVHDASGYQLYYQDARDQRIHEARSQSADPRSFERDVQSTGLLQGAAIDSPVVVAQNGGPRRWLWGDSYLPVNAELFVWQSSGGSAWQQASKQVYTQPVNAKLGGVTPITEAERAGLLAKFGAPTWRRIKSYNYADRLIRHVNFEGRVDPYPLEPYTDSEWDVVPGLAGSGVSIKSHAWAGWYLHDTGDGVKLEQDDGSDAFHRAATFVEVPGLANPAWTSFRSFADPTKYLRHREFKLRVEPVGTDLERADATFGIGY